MCECASVCMCMHMCVYLVICVFVYTCVQSACVCVSILSDMCSVKSHMCRWIVIGQWTEARVPAI